MRSRQGDHGPYCSSIRQFLHLSVPRGCMIFLALRGTFIINPDGKLTASEVNFYNVGRNADELLRKMQANLYLSGHPDEVCPANWHEGDKTIKPSAKIVGKVYEAMK